MFYFVICLIFCILLWDTGAKHFKIKFKFWFLIFNFGIFCEKKVQKFENQVQNLIFDCEFWHLLLRKQVKKFGKIKLYTLKWIGRVLASPILVLQLFDFLIFCCLVLIEKCAQNIAKLSWKIRGGAFFIFLHFFVRKVQKIWK